MTKKVADEETGDAPASPPKTTGAGRTMSMQLEAQDAKSLRDLLQQQVDQQKARKPLKSVSAVFTQQAPLMLLLAMGGLLWASIPQWFPIDKEVTAGVVVGNMPYFWGYNGMVSISFYLLFTARKASESRGEGTQAKTKKLGREEPSRNRRRHRRKRRQKQGQQDRQRSQQPNVRWPQRHHRQ